MSKTLLVGLDGATWEIIKPMIAQGRLPNIARLVRQGVSGKLQSVNPPLSAPAWVSFMTGKNPGKHGVISFYWEPQNPYFNDSNNKTEIVNSTYFRRNSVTLFDILSVEGKKNGVINLPCTHPTWKVNGFMVSGFLTPQNAEYFTFPQSLSKEIQDNIADYKIDLKFGIKLDENGQNIKSESPNGSTQNLRNLIKEKITGFEALEEDKRELLCSLFEITDIRTKTIDYLIKKYSDLDFLLIYFRELDVLCHYFWDKKEIVEDYYSLIDQKIGEIFEYFSKDDNIFLISDHGFGPIEQCEFNLNYLLLQKKFFFVKSEIKKQKLSSVYRFCKKNFKFLKRFFSKKIRKQFKQQILFPQVDWTKTIAYGKSHSALVGININLKGRERFGIVESAEYESIRDKIINELKDTVDPITGNKIFQAIKKKEDIYCGDFLNKIPDIVLITRPEYQARLLLNNSIVSKFGRRLERSGSHARQYEGIFIASGPEIRQEEFIKNARLIDVAPTILFMMNCPIAEDMDGKVLKEVFMENSKLFNKEITYKKYKPEDMFESKAYPSSQNQEEIEQQLRALGYLD